MANVQLEHGFTKIANELLDAIQSFQFTQNQFKLLLALWRNTYGWNRKQCEFSLNQIIRQTGLQRKRVIETLKSLEESNVIIEVKAPIGSSPKIVEFNKNYTTWAIKKYAGMEISSGHGDTPKEELPVVKTTPPTSGHSDTPLVVTPTPLSSGHGDTSRVGQNDTPINTKDKLNTKNINTAATGGSNVVDYNSKNYLKNLLERFIQLRGFGFDPSPMDLAAAKEIMEAGIPLQTAIEGMEEVFNDYRPRHQHDRIRALKYCVGRIMDKHFGKGSATPQKKSLFDPSPETLKRQQEQIEKYKGKEIDMTGLPY